MARGDGRGPGRRALLAAAPLGLLAACAPVTATQRPARPTLGQVDPDFPAIPRGLPPTRRRVLTTARAEHADQGPGTRYAEGVVEPWCADFASWVLREAGVPLRNPASGGWRIPGVLTLTDHLRGTGRFREAGSGYAPVPGDLLVWAKGSMPGEHVHFLVTRRGHDVVTVGGNEGDAIKVRHLSLTQPGLVGYGLPGRGEGTSRSRTV